MFDQVWRKRRVDPLGDVDVRSPRRDIDIAKQSGAVGALVPLHPVSGMSPSACTAQGGRPGPWHRRLPHFRPDAVPSVGAELQTEYFVGRDDGPAALRAVHRLRDQLAALVLVTEVRTVAADEYWLSPAFERDSVAIHFTWRADMDGVMATLPAIERALAPFDPRPHWAKLATVPSAVLRRRYPRFDDATRLRLERDPAGRFGNEFLDDVFTERER